LHPWGDDWTKELIPFAPRALIVVVAQVASSLFTLRREMVEIGRRMYERGLVVAAEGNISARLPEGNILITPAGFCKGRMNPEDMVVVTAEGKKVQGNHRASTELGMHLTALGKRPDVRAAVHAHPPYATAFAVAGIPLADCILPEVVATLGGVPLADYATPSTPQVGASIERYLDKFDAFLLKNHGVLTLGPDLESAFRKMETVERFAQIIHLARSLGTVDEMTCKQVNDLLALTHNLHSRFSGAETPVCGHCHVGTGPSPSNTPSGYGS
jgi:L-fuculose-phosphate aldolase